jgi:hypothetical protein
MELLRRTGKQRNSEGSFTPSVFIPEDNSGDVELLRLALEDHQVTRDLFVAGDGEKGTLIHP